MPSARVGWSNGIAIERDGIRLLLDPAPGSCTGPDSVVFVTHAHADHTYGLATRAKKYATPETKAIYEMITGVKLESLREMPLGTSVKLDGIEVVARNAGHMVGSAQFEVRLPEETIVYTGDINCVDTLTTSAAEPIECDQLVIEATYGAPYYQFPPRERTYARIVDWVLDQVSMGRIPTFQAYASGKAQELMRLFNLYTRLRVVSHPSVHRVNEACRRSGLELSGIPLQEGVDLAEEPSIYLTVPRDGSRLPPKATVAVATGWALRYGFGGATAFPLSSHADFNQLVQFVGETKAKAVYTVSTYARELADALTVKLGVRATPLAALDQRTLPEYQAM